MHHLLKTDEHRREGFEMKALRQILRVSKKQIRGSSGTRQASTEVY